MADQQDAETGFVPEPIPDNIADTEINGFNPDEDSTESQQVDTTDDETSDTQPDDTAQTDDDEGEEAGEPSEDSKDDKSEQSDEKPAEDTEESRKRHNDEMARQRIEQRKQRDYVSEQRQQIREYEKTANMEDVAERMKVLEAKQYVDTVERNRASLVNENLQAQQSIDLFNPNKKDTYNERAYQMAVQRFNDNYVITDPDTGEVLGAQDRQGNNISLLNYLQQEASALQEVLGSTKRQSQAAEAKMRAKAIAPQGTGKSTTSGDELEDLLDRIGDTPLY